MDFDEIRLCMWMAYPLHYQPPMKGDMVTALARIGLIKRHPRGGKGHLRVV